uniref:Uncharacterized protein n=1 Tax=Avena sativa TaxID=4498 RepID=A0ACD6AMH9_AVESA
MVLGFIAGALSTVYAGSLISGDGAKKVPIIGDALSTAANFVKVVGKDGKAAPSSSSSSSSVTGDQLLSQVTRLREEMQQVLRERDEGFTVIHRSGNGAYTVTAVVVVGLVGYAYIRWKGWKLADMMWVTKRGLNDACTVVGTQLNEVSDTVNVTKKHLAGRIDRVDATLDETQEIIEGTRDEVTVINVNLSSFQKELQEVNRTVEIWGSRLCSIEDTQDRTVRATEALVGFGQQMEHGQNATFRQVSSFVPALGSSSEKIVRRLPPPTPLALETISSVAGSEQPTVDETQENHKVLPSSEGSTRWKLPVKRKDCPLSRSARKRAKKKIPSPKLIPSPPPPPHRVLRGDGHARQERPKRSPRVSKNPPSQLRPSRTANQSASERRPSRRRASPPGARQTKQEALRSS